MANDNKGEVARILSSLLLVMLVTIVPWFLVKWKGQDITVTTFVCFLGRSGVGEYLAGD